MDEAFRQLVQSFPFGLYVVDAEFRVVEANSAARKLFENVQPLLGRDFADAVRCVWPEPFAGEIIDRFRHTLATGEPFHAPGTVERRRDTAEIEAYDWKIARMTLPDGRFGVVCHFYDFSERQRYEAALRAGEERFRLRVEQSVDGIFVADGTGHYVDVNPAGCDMLGYTRAEILERSIADVVAGEEIHRIPAEVARLAGGGITRSEWRFRRKDGSGFVGEVVARQLPDGRLQAVLRDIDERRRAEAELRQSQLDFARAQEVAQIGSWRLDVRRNILNWSAENYRIFGIPPGTPLTYQSFLVCVHPDDRPEVDARWQAALRGEPYDIEHRLVTPEGVKWVREKAFLEFDEAGQLLGGFGITQDITQLKKAEAILADSRQQLALALEAGQVGFWDWNIQTGRVQFGGRWAAMLGYRLEEVEPYVSAWERLVHPDDRSDVMARLTDHLEGRTGFYECEHRVRHRDGSWRWILDRGQVVERDAGGRPVRAVGTHTDVTARRIAEDALREADRRKDEFLAILGHELRNPLAPIRNAVNVLLRMEGDAPDSRDSKRQRLLAMIERHVTHLVRLVDDLLEVSRITRGKITLHRQRVDLAATVLQALEASQPLIQAGGHRFELSLPEESLVVDGDPVRLAQIVSNLLNNAAKYMEKGGTVNLAIERRGPEAVVSVRDFGIGISAEMLPRVFDLFTQADGTIVHSQGGLGIGLSLVRQLAELHGGRVEACSEGLGRGSEFRVFLPLAAGDAPNPEPAPQARKLADVAD
jgi:PAS domain S-box-containing protein